MKKLIFSLCAVFALILSGCQSDDDPQPAVVSPAIQELCTQMNTNATSISALVKAVTDDDKVTSIVPLTDSRADASAYTVSFVKSQSIKIYLDKNGGSSADKTPVLGTKLDTDEHYYWTLDDEWLLDNSGKKISVENASNTPQLDAKKDGWYISVDGGSSWRFLGGSTENGSDSMFREIDLSDPDFVTFVLTNGTRFTLARQPDLTITFDEDDLIAMRPNSTRTIGYTISGQTDNLSVEVMWSGNVKAKISDSTSASGSLTITTGATIDDSDKVMLIASNGQGRIIKSISFEETALTVTSGTSYTVAAEGGTISINIETNANYTLSIPDEAKSWLSVSESRAMRQETITLEIAPNENASRSATVALTDSDGFSFASLLITQSGNSIPLSAFPDENFRKYIKENFDTDNDDVISAEEADKVTEIKVQYSDIASLQGIEYFTNLTTLWCYNNRLTSLDLSENTALTVLSCFANQLTSLDLSKNTALTDLSCFDNQLTELNLSNNTALTYLHCDHNKLTSLDLSNNTALTYLQCNYNQLTSLDVTKNTALTDLRCLYNELTSLKVSKNNTELTSLDCSGNQLTNLYVGSIPALTDLSCHDNQLTELNLYYNAKLHNLNCYNNLLTELDLSETDMNRGHLACRMNGLLNKLILKSGWIIEDITPNRYPWYIDPETQIIFVD